MIKNRILTDHILVTWQPTSLFFQEFSRFHSAIQPMYDGILNNRKNWKERQEEYESKLKELEEAAKAKQETAANKGLNSSFLFMFNLYVVNREGTSNQSLFTAQGYISNYCNASVCCCVFLLFKEFVFLYFFLVIFLQLHLPLDLLGLRLAQSARDREKHGGEESRYSHRREGIR